MKARIFFRYVVHIDEIVCQIYKHMMYKISLSCLLDTLKNILDNIPEKPVNQKQLPTMLKHKENPSSSPRSAGKSTSAPEQSVVSNSEPTSEDLQSLYADFLEHDEITGSLNTYKHALEKKLTMAKLCSEAIRQCQRNILFLKRKLDIHLNGSPRNVLINELEEQQNTYKKALAELKDLQYETMHLQAGLEQAQEKAQQKFQEWLRIYKHGSKHHIGIAQSEMLSNKESSAINERNKNLFDDAKTKEKLESCWRNHKYVEKSIDTDPMKCKSTSMLQCHSLSKEFLPDTDSLEVLLAGKPDKFNGSQSAQSLCSNKSHFSMACSNITSCYCKENEAQGCMMHCHIDTCNCNEACMNQPTMNKILQTCTSDQIFSGNDNLIYPLHVTSSGQTILETQSQSSGNTCMHNLSNHHVSNRRYGIFRSKPIGSPDDLKIQYIPNYGKPIPVNNDICCYPGRITFTRNESLSNKETTNYLNEEVADDECDYYWCENCTPVVLCSQCSYPVVQNVDGGSLVNSNTTSTSTLSDNSEKCESEVMNSLSADKIKHDEINDKHPNNSRTQATSDGDVSDLEPDSPPDKGENFRWDRFFRSNDSEEFRAFIKTVTLTGEPEVDEEVINFYRTKFE